MFVKNIELKNFRNYSNQTLEFTDGINILIGNNAQGKTNILEAVYVSLFGKSFRTSSFDNMIGSHKDFFNIRTLLEKDYETLDIDYSYSKAHKRNIKINRKEIRKTSDLFKKSKIVIFSPDDLRIVKDDPAKRRKFIDIELSKIRPAYFDALSLYNQTLKQRNSYIKNEIPTADMLDVWDSQLAQYGAEVIIRRKEFIKILEKKCSEINLRITDGREYAEIDYESDIPVFEGVDATASEFYDILLAARDNDIRRRTTTRGPHRDDIKISTGGMDARRFGSQGQQRTLALSLKLSEIELIRDQTGEAGILLLDDVLSELDISRQQYLMKVFNDVQLFITSTEMPFDISAFSANYKIFTVKEGHIR